MRNRKVAKKRLLVLLCLSVCLSARPNGRTRFNWTDFHEIWYGCFRAFVEKMQVPLKFQKNNK